MLLKTFIERLFANLISSWVRNKVPIASFWNWYTFIKAIKVNVRRNRRKILRQISNIIVRQFATVLKHIDEVILTLAY